jgi:predicted nuclease with TOPRIM domain
MTTREKNLVLLFPSLLCIIVYSWFYLKPLQKRLKEQGNELSQLLKKPPSTSELLLSSKKLSQQEQERVQLQEKIQKLQRESQTLQNTWKTQNPLVLFTQVLQVFEAHNVILIEESELPPSRFKKPATLVSFEELFALEQAQEAPHPLRQFQVLARFQEMASVMEALGQISLFPVSLTMEPLPSLPSYHRWRLVLWI